VQLATPMTRTLSSTSFDRLFCFLCRVLW
jgi:hypothetical protein